VDNRGWELLQMSGDGGPEGGWMYIFKQKPPIDLRIKFRLPHESLENIEESKERSRGHNKFKSYPSTEAGQPLIQRKHSDSL